MTWLPWLLLGLSIAINGAAMLLLLGCFRERQEILKEIAKAQTLVDFAIAELLKPRDLQNDGKKRLLAELLKDWQTDARVH